MKQMDITTPACSDREGDLVEQDSTAGCGRQLDGSVTSSPRGHDVNVVAHAAAGTEGGRMPDVTRFLTALGQSLRERREELRLTQEAVSLLTGVPQRRIWEIEAGIGNPT